MLAPPPFSGKKYFSMAIPLLRGLSRFQIVKKSAWNYSFRGG
jgi:hypothetical protein